MQAVAHNPSFAKKVGIKPSVGAEYTQSNVGKKSYEKLPERLKNGGPSLAIGRGEKLPASKARVSRPKAEPSTTGKQDQI